MFIKSFATKCIIGILAAIVLDSVWLGFYFKPWWSTGYSDSFSLLGLRRASLIFSFILMFVRVVVLAGLFIGFSSFENGTDEFAGSGNTNAYIQAT